MLEKEIEYKLGKLIRARSGLYYKFVSPGARGVPDRIVITPGGKVVFVELKAEDGQLSSLQKWQHQQLKSHSVDVRTIWSWEDAKAFVEEVMPCEVHPA